MKTPMPSAGELDRRIQLQRATITNDPEYNEEVSTWATYATVWAKQEFHRANEGEDASRLFAELGLYFTIRWRDDFSQEHRVIYDGDTYEVVGHAREIGRRRFLKFQARLIE